MGRPFFVSGPESYTRAPLISTAHPYNCTCTVCTPSADSSSVPHTSSPLVTSLPSTVRPVSPVSQARNANTASSSSAITSSDLLTDQSTDTIASAAAGVARASQRLHNTTIGLRRVTVALDTAFRRLQLVRESLAALDTPSLRMPPSPQSDSSQEATSGFASVEPAPVRPGRTDDLAPAHSALELMHGDEQTGTSSEWQPLLAASDRVGADSRSDNEATWGVANRRFLRGVANVLADTSGDAPSDRNGNGPSNRERDLAGHSTTLAEVSRTVDDLRAELNDGEIALRRIVAAANTLNGTRNTQPRLNIGTAATSTDSNTPTPTQTTAAELLRNIRPQSRILQAQTHRLPGSPIGGADLGVDEGATMRSRLVALRQQTYEAERSAGSSEGRRPPQNFAASTPTTPTAAGSRARWADAGITAQPRRPTLPTPSFVPPPEFVTLPFRRRTQVGTVPPTTSVPATASASPSAPQNATSATSTNNDSTGRTTNENVTAALNRLEHYLDAYEGPTPPSHLPDGTGEMNPPTNRVHWTSHWTQPDANAPLAHVPPLPTLPSEGITDNVRMELEALRRRLQRLTAITTEARTRAIPRQVTPQPGANIGATSTDTNAERLSYASVRGPDGTWWSDEVVPDRGYRIRRRVEPDGTETVSVIPAAESPSDRSDLTTPRLIDVSRPVPAVVQEQYARLLEPRPERLGGALPASIVPVPVPAVALGGGSSIPGANTLRPPSASTPRPGAVPMVREMSVRPEFANSIVDNVVYDERGQPLVFSRDNEDLAWSRDWMGVGPVLQPPAAARPLAAANDVPGDDSVARRIQAAVSMAVRDPGLDGWGSTSRSMEERLVDLVAAGRQPPRTDARPTSTRTLRRVEVVDPGSHDPDGERSSGRRESILSAEVIPFVPSPLPMPLVDSMARLRIGARVIHQVEGRGPIFER